MKRTTRLLLLLTALASAAGATSPAPQAPAPPPYGPPITLEQALQIAAVAETEARSRHVAITIAIVDSGGTLVLEHRMDGASLVSAQTAAAKAQSAVLWQRPTSSWIATVSSNPAPLTLPHVIASNGGELLILGGHIAGAVGVGGSVQNEGDIAKLAVAALGSNAAPH